MDARALELTRRASTHACRIYNQLAVRDSRSISPARLGGENGGRTPDRNTQLFLERRAEAYSLLVPPSLGRVSSSAASLATLSLLRKR